MKRIPITLSIFTLLALCALVSAAMLIAADQDNGQSPAGGGVDPGPEVLTTPRARTGPAPENVLDRRADIRVDKQTGADSGGGDHSDGPIRHRPGQGKLQALREQRRAGDREFPSEDAPMSVGIVFDTSGSMGSKLQRSRQAVAEFMKTANPEDEFFLVQFNDRPELTVHFTPDTEEIQNRLMFTQSKGRTALLDGVYMAMNEMKKARNPRKAILIISDGGDNSSRYTESEVRNVVREADVQIYAIGIFEPAGARGRTPEEADGPGSSARSGGTDRRTRFRSGQSGRTAGRGGQDRTGAAQPIRARLQPEEQGSRREVPPRSGEAGEDQGLGQITPRWRLGYYAPTQ